MARELICNDCGQTLGDPVQSNIDRHKADNPTHKNIVDRELMLDDGSPSSNPGEKPVEKLIEEKQGITVEEQKEIEELAEEKETPKKTSKFNKSSKY